MTTSLFQQVCPVIKYHTGVDIYDDIRMVRREAVVGNTKRVHSSRKGRGLCQPFLSWIKPALCRATHKGPYLLDPVAC